MARMTQPACRWLTPFSQKKIDDAIGRRCLSYFRIDRAFSCLRRTVSMSVSAEAC
jgi:hypothetical protein